MMSSQTDRIFLIKTTINLGSSIQKSQMNAGDRDQLLNSNLANTGFPKDLDSRLLNKESIGNINENTKMGREKKNSSAFIKNELLSSNDSRSKNLQNINESNNDIDEESKRLAREQKELEEAQMKKKARQRRNTAEDLNLIVSKKEKDNVKDKDDAIEAKKIRNENKKMARQSKLLLEKEELEKQENELFKRQETINEKQKKSLILESQLIVHKTNSELVEDADEEGLLVSKRTKKKKGNAEDVENGEKESGSEKGEKKKKRKTKRIDEDEEQEEKPKWQKDDDVEIILDQISPQKNNIRISPQKNNIKISPSKNNIKISMEISPNKSKYSNNSPPNRRNTNNIELLDDSNKKSKNNQESVEGLRQSQSITQQQLEKSKNEHSPKVESSKVNTDRIDSDESTEEKKDNSNLDRDNTINKTNSEDDSRTMKKTNLLGDEKIVNRSSKFNLSSNPKIRYPVEENNEESPSKTQKYQDDDNSIIKKSPSTRTLLKTNKKIMKSSFEGPDSDHQDLEEEDNKNHQSSNKILKNRISSVIDNNKPNSLSNKQEIHNVDPNEESSTYIRGSIASRGPKQSKSFYAPNLNFQEKSEQEIGKRCETNIGLNKNLNYRSSNTHTDNGLKTQGPNKTAWNFDSNRPNPPVQQEPFGGSLKSFSRNQTVGSKDWNITNDPQKNQNQNDDQRLEYQNPKRSSFGGTGHTGIIGVNKHMSSKNLTSGWGGINITNDAPKKAMATYETSQNTVDNGSSKFGGVEKIVEKSEKKKIRNADDSDNSWDN